MAMTVTLYKNSKVDGLTRLGCWRTKADQINYFDTLTSITLNTNTVGLGEPLRVKAKLNDLLNYGYGHIDYGDSFRYYFAVADLTFVTETITDISYTIDCFDTALRQTNMALGRAVFSRAPFTNSITTYPYAPTSYHYTYKALGKNEDYCFFAVVNVKDATTQKSYIHRLALKLPRLIEPTADIFHDIIELYFDYGYTFENGDIYNICVSPIYPDFTKAPNVSAITKKADCPTGYDMYLCLVDSIYSVRDAGDWIVLEGELSQYDVVRDCRGNEVMTVAPGQSISLGTVAVLFSAASIMVYLRGTSYIGSQSDPIDIPVPCEYLDVYVDQYKEYFYRQRAIDIESRNMQLNQGLVNNLLGAGTSGMSGAIGGGMAGVGAGMGALAGVGIGVAQSLGTYAIGAYYSPKEQKLIDTSYRNLTQTLKNSGGAVHMWLKSQLWGVWTKTFEKTFESWYENDIQANGNYTYAVVSSYSTEPTYFKAGPVTAEVEVLGDIPVSWKEQIHSRFSQGVKLV